MEASNFTWFQLLLCWLKIDPALRFTDYTWVHQLDQLSEVARVEMAVEFVTTTGLVVLDANTRCSARFFTMHPKKNRSQFPLEVRLTPVLTTL